MTTLFEAIAPDRFEIVSTFPISSRFRDHATTPERALDIARGFLAGPGIHCVQVTAYGTNGTPHDRGFAIRNLERVDGDVTDSGWRCWLGAGQFIGAVDG